jgi:hypothetical protein
MTYRLIQLAPGAYDLILNGEVMGSVVRNSSYQPYTWTAELLEELPLSKRPPPFTKIEHDFPTLEELRVWLGNPGVRSNSGNSLALRPT